MRILIALLCCLTLTHCSSNSNANDNCQFLLDIPVNQTINLNFPQFIQLQSPTNPVYIPNVGNGGIIITNVGSGFAAFDAADPNRTFSSCSILTINGIIGENSCEDKNRYSLLDGTPIENGELQCALRRYRVTQNGNTLTVFN
ncbi:hypothetical protein MHTCC0001_30880 [Flavobacteriaceae bacterium MHTCC 0001]